MLNLFQWSFICLLPDAFPSHARVVICGGGVQGAAIGYYLAQLGWGKDTIILDQGKVGGGTPWHMSGLIGAYKPSPAETIMAQESIRLYQDLTEKGHSIGFKQCGSLLLARTRDRLTHFRRMKAHSVSRDIDCSVLSPADIAKRYPYLNTKDIQGGLWIPKDAVGDPTAICLSLAQLASAQGVKIFEQIQVHRVMTQQRKVSAVETDRGTIKCDYFINCAGFWARSLGKKTQPLVKVPVQAVEHHYLHTKKVEGIDEEMPAIRDMDGRIYIRVKDGSYLAGGISQHWKFLYLALKIKMNC